jgi:membrane protease YdiL (CAAX protease family)
LALRAAGCEPYPQGEWRLRDAWFALFASLIPSFLALYCAGPLDVQVSVPNWSIDAEPKQLARIALVESLLTLAFLLPLARLGAQHQARWWGTQWSTARCLAVGIAVGIALRAPLLVMLAFTHGKFGQAAPQEPLWQLLSAIREHYGPVSALWLLVMFAPVIEEFVFRGVLLKAFTAHLRFGWANAAQAALFAAMHMDLKATPVLFLLALIAGVLARRSEGLLAPMALHATFNLVAGIVLLSR